MDKLQSATVQINLDNGQGMVNGGRYSGILVRCQVHIPALLNNKFIKPSSKVFGMITMFKNGQWCTILQVEGTLSPYFLPTEEMIKIGVGGITGRFLDVEKNAIHDITKQAAKELADWLTVEKS